MQHPPANAALGAYDAVVNGGTDRQSVRAWRVGEPIGSLDAGGCLVRIRTMPYPPKVL
jgi:hypothetical protein